MFGGVIALWQSACFACRKSQVQSFATISRQGWKRPPSGRRCWSWLTTLSKLGKGVTLEEAVG